MSQPPNNAQGSSSGVPASLPRQRGLLAGMRIRKKLLVLHTCFSLVLAAILALALRPAIAEVIRQAEGHEAGVVLAFVLDSRAGQEPSGPGGDPRPLLSPLIAEQLGRNVRVISGDARSLAIDDPTERQLRAAPGVPSVRAIIPDDSSDAPQAVAFDPRSGEFVGVKVVLESARQAVTRLYVLFTGALLAVYALVAAALELFVLPKAVYQPIATMLDADTALQEGRRSDEIIAPSSIPADELGEIMRSRNQSVLSLRRHEAELALALGRLEEVATDLKRKNHLLETARQNLADADRLASLGMMSAGIAHELNTPLAVLKGLVEKLNASAGAEGPRVTPAEAALMLRVVGRLERLSESLLDFARVRPFTRADRPVRPLVEEAWTLVRLDRQAARAELVNAVPPERTAFCDADRIVQVLVNVLRNAVDAAIAAGRPAVRIDVRADAHQRDDAAWVSITIADDGPGIHPQLLDKLFEPFVSSRLDSKGTGLGLAVAHGIVREHGGVLLARNRAAPSSSGAPAGAIFEIVLPAQGARRTDDLPLQSAHVIAAENSPE